MDEKGYVYALINPSLEGMVKIGKTTRSPDERAMELSSATGVPTPFFVAYKIYVNDCDQAEKYMHTLLFSKGFRVSDRREFFQMPLDKAIELMIDVQSKYMISSDFNSYEVNKPTGDEFLDSLDIEENDNCGEIPSSNPWDDIESLAWEYYTGMYSELQDYGEAIKLYKQAFSLGSTTACIQLSEMYRDGEGCAASLKLSLDYLKKGAMNGSGLCYAYMADIFIDQDHISNATKCWEKYFKSDDFWLCNEDSDLKELNYLAQVKAKIIDGNILKSMLLSQEDKVIANAKAAVKSMDDDELLKEIRERKYQLLLRFYAETHSL